jgi:hypothetical protein
MPVEGRGLGSRPTHDVVRDRRLGMTLATPSSIQKLQTALHAKAKEEPEYRFYLLYDKVYRGDVLQHAYACCKANKGAAGVDDERFEDIEAYGVERWLGELAEDLRNDLSIPGGPAGVPEEAEWKAAAHRYSPDTRQGGADGRGMGADTDIRS